MKKNNLQVQLLFYEMRHQLYRRLDVFCHSCKALLLIYQKGGKGQLIKCHLHRIIEDYCKKPGICHNCQRQWGKLTIIRNKPALKIIGNRVYWM